LITTAILLRRRVQGANDLNSTIKKAIVGTQQNPNQAGQGGQQDRDREQRKRQRREPEKQGGGGQQGGR
jgi:hypothetical protein